MFPTPYRPGRLSNVDCRWDAIAQSVDDRTPTERGEIPEGGVPEDCSQRPYMAGGGERETADGARENRTDKCYLNGV